VTADSNLICRRCGFANIAGDQFCGSCGAFLEWEGEPAAGSTPPVDTRDPDIPAVRPAGGPGSAVPLPVSPTTPTVTGTQAPVAQPDAGLIRCPACGIANASSRTFCQSCGSRLADAARVAEVSQAQIAAAVNAPNRPPVPPTTVVRPIPGESGKRTSGGVIKWIAIMAVLGIVVGAGAVGLGLLFKGKAPATDATTGPGGAGASAGASGAAVSGAPSGSAGSSGAPGASPTSAPKSVALTLLSATASSVVGDLPKFQPSSAIDGDPKTCWQEGSHTEKGEWIEVKFAPSTVTSLLITNGYNASRALYLGNLRLKDVAISIDGGAPVTVRLADTGKPQKVNVKDTKGATTVRITIVSTYGSVQTSVSGTPFDDAALGEIVVNGIPGS
jgi:hypothetical protein